MIMGCVLYPNNWDSSRVTSVCETSSSYYVGKCTVRWAYILAIVGIFDILFLAILAFVMARRQANNFQESQINFADKSFYPAIDNNGFDGRGEQIVKSRSRRNSMHDFEL
jgi:hypothetical protein